MISGRIRPKLVLPKKPGPNRVNDDSFGTNRNQQSGFIKNSYYNGLGRHVNQLARLTIKFSHTSVTSHGVRDFIQLNLVDFCRQYPGIAVYLKPRYKQTPVLLSEYLNGNWHWMNLRDMKADQMLEWLNYHVERSGEELKRLRKPSHTDWPSIQGVWTPYTNLPPHLATTQWPNKERGEFTSNLTTGTEQVLKLQKENELNSSHILEQHTKDK